MALHLWPSEEVVGARYEYSASCMDDDDDDAKSPSRQRARQPSISTSSVNAPLHTRLGTARVLPLAAESRERTKHRKTGTYFPSFLLHIQ